jgi:hypothetical protein
MMTVTLNPVRTNNQLTLLCSVSRVPGWVAIQICNTLSFALETGNDYSWSKLWQGLDRQIPNSDHVIVDQCFDFP